MPTLRPGFKIVNTGQNSFRSVQVVPVSDPRPTFIGYQSIIIGGLPHILLTPAPSKSSPYAADAERYVRHGK